MRIFSSKQINERKREMKKIMVAALAVCAIGAFAQEATSALVETSDDPASWRLTVGGFGRGDVRTRLKGGAADHEQVWGADMDVQYSVWQNNDFSVWLGVGGSFCPSQNAYGRNGASRRSEHQVSDDGFVTYDFDYASGESRSVELGYGEFRIMSVPEWKVTEDFFVGARLGVAFDWIRAKSNSGSSWKWNSESSIDIPGIPASIDTDADRGGAFYSDTMTKFAAQAILGLQATYLFTDNLGLYAACDWRLGGNTTFNTAYGDSFDVKMNGWYASAGLVFQF